MKGKKAIFFDYGGTLDAPGIAWKENFYKIYKRHGLNVDFERFSRAFYDSDDSLTLKNPVSFNLTEVVYEQVKRVLEGLNCFSSDLQKKVSEDFLNSSFENIKRNLKVLKKLKKRFKIGIISNNYGNLKEICKETGLINVLDVMVDSNLVGAIKPSRKIFFKGLKALNVTPEEAVMVGDNIKRDIIGALDIGMDAILISPENKRNVMVPQGVQVIKDISEVLNIVWI